ncbi:hypothetical protein AcW1_000775 [Taiwanofungus camphoratus]|nr:hypothetical protein AcW1_000775 [Antrodia cinnamomea]
MDLAQADLWRKGPSTQFSGLTRRSRSPEGGPPQAAWKPALQTAQVCCYLKLLACIMARQLVLPGEGETCGRQFDDVKVHMPLAVLLGHCARTKKFICLQGGAQHADSPLL